MMSLKCLPSRYGRYILIAHIVTSALCSLLWYLYSAGENLRLVYEITSRKPSSFLWNSTAVAPTLLAIVCSINSLLKLGLFNSNPELNKFVAVSYVNIRKRFCKKNVKMARPYTNNLRHKQNITFFQPTNQRKTIIHFDIQRIKK